jgi:hypothetical protein
LIRGNIRGKKNIAKENEERDRRRGVPGEQLATASGVYRELWFCVSVTPE